jgi:molybdopterin converting factor small subunit
MPITVKLPTILRTHAGGAPVVEATGATLAEILSDLDARYPGLTDRLRKDGGLSRFVNVYVNEEDARHLGALEAPIAEGDTVSIIPAVAGG